jgi:hypothetical protein
MILVDSKIWTYLGGAISGLLFLWGFFYWIQSKSSKKQLYAEIEGVHEEIKKSEGRVQKSIGRVFKMVLKLKK